MPDRVVRDEIVGSDRWLGLRRNTHRLGFLVALLAADDLGNFEAGEGALWRLWRDPLGLTDRQSVAEILLALTDADLLRLYEVDQKRYAHIPRFRQRLRYVNGKHPRPPTNIECAHIKGLVEKRPTTVRLKPDHGQTAVGPQSAEVKRSRSEEKRSEVEVAPKSYPQAEAPSTEKPFDRKQVNGESQKRAAAFVALLETAKRLGLEPASDETAPEFELRVDNALAGRATS